MVVAMIMSTTIRMRLVFANAYVKHHMHSNGFRYDYVKHHMHSYGSSQ